MKIELNSTKCQLRDLRLQRKGPLNVCTCRSYSATSSRRSAMTLIELLVVIIILTTLVAGVIPVLSPNNDTRKIREAARGLQTYITMAQAKAARTGRSHGIGFRESLAGEINSDGNGIALEVFQLEVPPPFAGFSTHSRVTVTEVSTEESRYLYGNVQKGNGNKRFSPEFDGYRLYTLHFALHSTNNPISDPFPPRMIRVGDSVNVEGNQFMIIDHGPDIAQPNKIVNIDDIEYIEPDTSTSPPNRPYPTYCIWLNSEGQVPPQGQKRYKIERLPVPTSEAPYQLPTSIILDMQASVVESSNTQNLNRFPTNASLYQTVNQILDTQADLDIKNASIIANNVNIMFSPNGSVNRVKSNYHNFAFPTRVALLLGRIENGGLSSNNTDWMISQSARKDELEDLQERINWLNLDSRWLSIGVSSGRVVVSENAYVDARQANLIVNDPFETAELQIEASHGIAHDMQQGGGG